MSENEKQQKPLSDKIFDDIGGYLSKTIFVWRLTWRLFWDGRVKLVHKLLPLLAIAYLFSPIDLIPEQFLGPLGLADDFILMQQSLSGFLKRVNQETGRVYAEHYRKLKER